MGIIESLTSIYEIDIKDICNKLKQLDLDGSEAGKVIFAVQKLGIKTFPSNRKEVFLDSLHGTVESNMQRNSQAI